MCFLDLVILHCLSTIDARRKGIKLRDISYYAMMFGFNTIYGAEADLRKRALSAAKGWGPSAAENFNFGRPKKEVLCPLLYVLAYYWGPFKALKCLLVRSAGATFNF